MNWAVSLKVQLTGCRLLFVIATSSPEKISSRLLWWRNLRSMSFALPRSKSLKHRRDLYEGLCGVAKKEALLRSHLNRTFSRTLN